MGQPLWLGIVGVQVVLLPPIALAGYLTTGITKRYSLGFGAGMPVLIALAVLLSVAWIALLAVVEQLRQPRKPN